MAFATLMAVLSNAEMNIASAAGDLWDVIGAEIFLCLLAFVLTQTVLGSSFSSRPRGKGEAKHQLKARDQQVEAASASSPASPLGAPDFPALKVAVHNKDLENAIQFFKAAQGTWPQPLSAGGRALVTQLVHLVSEIGVLPKFVDDCHAAGFAAADIEAVVIASVHAGGAGNEPLCCRAEELARANDLQPSPSVVAALVTGYGDLESAARLFAEAARKGQASFEVLSATLKVAGGAKQSFVDAVLGNCQGPVPATVAATLILHQLGQPLRSRQGQQPLPALPADDASVEKELALLALYEHHLLGVPLSTVDRAVGWFVVDVALRHGRQDLLPGIAACMGEEFNHQAAVRALGRSHRALDAARLMRACPDQSQCLYNALLDVCAEAGEVELAEEVMQEAVAAGKANVVTYNTMLKVHTAGRKGYACTKLGTVLDKLQAYDFQPNHVTGSILLKSVQRSTPAEDVERALAVVDSIGEMDDVLLSSLIEACHRAGRTDLLHSRLRRLRSAPTARSCHAFASIIRAYGCLGDLPGAWEAWRDMRASGQPPSKIAVGCMVEALASNRETQSGYELIRQLRAEVNGKSLLNSVVYGTVLKGFAHQKNFEGVWKIYSEMLGDSVGFTVITFNTLVDACARCGEMGRLPEIFSEMSRQGIKPDQITYSATVKGYCQEGKVDRAYEVIGQMHRESDHKIDEFFYNALLGGCAKARLWSRGLQVFEEMQGMGFKTSNITLSVLVNLATRASSLDDAFALCDRAAAANGGLKLNGHVFNNLIQGCMNHKDPAKALAVLRRMVSEHVRPDERTYTLVLRAMLSAGRRTDAAALLRVACGLHGELPAELARIGPAALRFNGQLPRDLVTEVLENIARHGVESRAAAQTLCKELIRAGVAVNSRAMLRLAGSH